MHNNLIRNNIAHGIFKYFIKKGVDHYIKVVRTKLVIIKTVMTPTDYACIKSAILGFLWYSDVRWAPLYSKPLASQLFVQQLGHETNKGNIKVQHYWPFVRGIHQWLVDSPHKGPVTWKAFPCHDIMMGRITAIWHLCLCCLTYCGLVTPYCTRDLGQHWLR